MVVNPYAHVRRGDGVDADFPVFVPEGLALRMLCTDQVNRLDFLAAYNRQQRPRWNLRRQLTICAALLGMSALVWLLGLFVQLSLLETEYGRLKQDIRDAFHQVLPEENNIVSPLAQLQQKLDAFQEESELFASFRPGRLSPLEALEALSRDIPADGNVRLDDVLLAADSVRVTGLCDSFAAVSDWQDRLEKTRVFDVVDIQNQKKDAQTGKVHFTLSLSSTRAEP